MGSDAKCRGSAPGKQPGYERQNPEVAFTWAMRLACWGCIPSAGGAWAVEPEGGVAFRSGPGPSLGPVAHSCWKFKCNPRALVPFSLRQMHTCGIFHARPMPHTRICSGKCALNRTEAPQPTTRTAGPRSLGSAVPAMHRQDHAARYFSSGVYVPRSTGGWTNWMAIR